MDTRITYNEILQKKYNVLKKNLIIIDAEESRIKEFEDTIRTLDSIKQEEYEKKIKEKEYLTTTLDDEYKRLYELISLIEVRKRERDNYLDDYRNIIKQELIGLSNIQEGNELQEYSDRLETISDFLLNDEKYTKYKIEKERLIEEKKETETLLNKEDLKIADLELNLLVKLKELINNTALYDNLDFDEIDSSINKYNLNTLEKEKELSTYLNSYKVLLQSGLSDVEQEEYKTFIESLKSEYLDLLEKKYILIIYKLINDKKEQEVINVIEERLSKFEEYELVNDNKFDNIFSLIKDYQNCIGKQEEIVMTINSLENNIDRANDKINEIVEELNNPETVLLLKEFCIEKEYIKQADLLNTEPEVTTSEDFFKLDESNNYNEEVTEKENNDPVFEYIFPFEEKTIQYKFNAIKEVKDFNNIENLDASRNKALNVMKKVCSSIVDNKNETAEVYNQYEQSKIPQVSELVV